MLTQLRWTLLSAKQQGTSALSPFIHTDTEGESIVPRASLELQTGLKLKAKPTVVTSVRLGELLTEQLQVAAKLSQLKAKKEKLDKKLLKIAKKHDDNGNCDVNGEFLLTTVSAENSYCDPLELMKLGVKASVIKKATKKTPYSYPRVTRRTKVADLD